jgi:protein-S-isoprenylcysteine O-methyltransferase Ste14
MINRATTANAILRSLLWLAVFVFWANLVHPEHTSLRTIRGGLSAWLGISLIAGGWALHVWATITLARAISSTLQAPTNLIVTGPYRYVRNPIYLAAMAVFAGIYTLYNSWQLWAIISALGCGAIVHCVVVFVEEPATLKRLGPAYDEYRHTVPRWFPRLRA